MVNFAAIAAVAIIGALMIVIVSKSPHKEQATVNNKKEVDKARSYEKATFAGGCFWCLEPPYDKLQGVVAITPGYIGGHTSNPTYKEVCSGETGHTEAVEIIFDPQIISYEELLTVFWRQIDPTDTGGQFADRGSQYRTGIFYHSLEQKNQAQKSKDTLQVTDKFNKPIATEITAATTFYPAEDYHHNYYKKNPGRYQRYSQLSGRKEYQKRMKSKKDEVKRNEKDELKKKLTPLQFKVTQENGTEPPFNNKYWDNKEAGLYVDVISGEPLFTSLDKFDSGCGWPSFTQPLSTDSTVEKEDKSLRQTRTEVRSKDSDAHLGHVFNDGPGPDGLRYCINSAALRFIPVKELEKEGYGEYARLFE